MSTVLNQESLTMDTWTIVMLAFAGVSLVLFFARRRSRLHKES
jgi:hypothetical protein